MEKNKIIIGGVEFDKDCPENCPGIKEPFDMGGICFRCPIFNCVDHSNVGFTLIEPNEYRKDWAEEWKKWFVNGMKDIPDLRFRVESDI